MNRRRLIVNADDFGWSRGITDGIFHASVKGVVTSATLLVNQIASENAIALAAQNPALGIGIHLNLCDGYPVSRASEIPSLIRPDGTFFPAPELRKRLWTLKVSGKEVVTEFRAQIRWMKDRGLVPTHADTHHHIHFRPGITVPFRNALLAEGIKQARPAPVRVIRPGSNGSNSNSIRSKLVAGYFRRLQRTRLSSLASADYRLTILLGPQPRYEQFTEAFDQCLQLRDPGVYELECHPAFTEPGFSEKDSWRDRRELEMRFLGDPESRLRVKEAGWELINYRDLDVDTTL